jgi:hypothetical protein
VGLHGAGDLHRGQHEAAGRVYDKIDGNIVRSLLDRSNDCLGIFQVDVSRDRKAKKTALLLAVNQSDNSSAVLLFNRPDRLGTSHGVPPPHKQRLERHERNEDEEY